jgi:hypothetical protein
MKKMTLLKTTIVVVFLTVMTIVVLSSCSGTRVGCQQHSGYMGYR